MKNEQLEDLKQFISASVSQSEERLRSEVGQLEGSLRSEMVQLREDMNQGFQEVRQEMVDGFQGVGEAIDTIHKQLDEQTGINATVDKRLSKLEHQVS